MKKKTLIILVVGIMMLSNLSSCGKKLPNDYVLFEEKNIVASDFDGLGVEWGVYEDTNKLCKDAYSKIETAVDRLNPSLVRTMLNFDWVVYDFDNKGTDDISDDTWKYDFDNKYMINACRILDYCEAHDIKVALGVWNVIGSVDETKDQWKMIPNSTSDLRWAQLAADLMDYLVNAKGYSCIKWFVNSNEPNYTGAKGSSKNAYNTYEKWEQGVKNVRAAFDKAGLSQVDIIGGDTTGFNGSLEYLEKAAVGLKDTVNNYGVHMYISNYDIDSGTYGQNMKKLYDHIKSIDKTIGTEKPFLIWEGGLLDGKNVETDCNAYITNYSYGIRMTDYTIQSILGGVNGIAYWDLDDAMHFMYTETGSNPKEWGMFSTLAGAPANKQELRPWFHSSCLLTNLLSPGSTVYSRTENEPEENFRTIAVVQNEVSDGMKLPKDAGIVAVNRGTDTLTKTFHFDVNVENNTKVYVYLFSEKNLRLNESGFVIPNYSIDGSISDNITVEIPANTVVIISSREL